MIHKPVILLFACTALLSAASQLVLSTTSVGPIQVTPGSNGTPQTIQARNSGTGTLNLTATASAPWLAVTVEAAQSCTGGGTCNPVVIALNTSALAAGVYTGYVTLTDPNAIDSPQQVTVSINVAGIPNALTFYITPAGGATPSTYTQIFTQGSVTAKATTQSGGNWLTLISGGIVFSGYAVQVAAQKGQAAGTYTGSLVLTGAKAPDNQTINVTMIVTASPIVQPVTTPVTLTGFPGGPNAGATVSLNNIGAGTLNVTGATASSSTAGFLTASVAGANSITITAAPGTLAPGYYSGAVTIASNAANDSQISVPVVFTVETEGTPVIYRRAWSILRTMLLECRARRNSCRFRRSTGAAGHIRPESGSPAARDHARHRAGIGERSSGATLPRRARTGEFPIAL